MQKRGVSDVVATVIIIALVVVAISVVWLGVMPLIKDKVGSSDACNDVDVSIETAQGYTCWDGNQNITMIQVKKGSDDVNISGLKFLLSSGGNSLQYLKDIVLGKNSYNIFYLNTSKISKLDKIEIVPVVKSGSAKKDCSTVFVENIGGCNAGEIVGEVLVDTSCKANCSCASSTSILQTCSNGCGGSCSGTKQDGTAGFPIGIYNWMGLNTTRNNLTAYYVLMNNLSSDTAGYLGIGNNWEPVGTFSGNFNGNKNTISNLTISKSGVNYVGLFGYWTTGSISNVGLININVTGNTYVGGIAGYLVSGGTITNSYSTGKVSGSGIWSNCGGIVGMAQDGARIIKSYSGASVAGGNLQVGGLVGSLYDGSIINGSYSVGPVSCSSNCGGLLGTRVDSYVYDSYWDNQTSGKTTSAGGTGKTTSQMKNIVTYTNVSVASAWDFVGNPYNDTANNNYWNIDPLVNNGYPYLV